MMAKKYFFRIIIAIGIGIVFVLVAQSYFFHFFTDRMRHALDTMTLVKPVVYFPVVKKSEASAPSIPLAVVLIEHGSRDKKTVALTFDADMTPYMKQQLEKGIIKSWYDEKIINILEKENVPATLFITGMWAEIYPEKIKEFSKNPLLEIADHSYDHSAFNTPCFGLGETTDKKMEIEKTQKILEELSGTAPRYFRFPGGCHSEEDLKFVADLGVEPVQWDVISGDSYLKDPHTIVHEVLSNAHNGSIIVMHLDGGPHSPATSVALEDIIIGLRKKGFSFATVGDLMKL